MKLLSSTTPRAWQRRHAVLALAAAALLAACDNKPAAPGESARGSAQPVSLDAIAREAQGFPVGAAMSTRTVYVFFDPQCPHCAALWQAAKPLRGQAKFVWIPVGLLGPASGKQGAALLAAPDPVAAMDAHEASMSARQGGITAMGVPDDKLKAVEANGKLMDRYGFASVPVIVAKHAQTGALVTQEGSMGTAALAGLLGLAMPAGG